jgi:hypothetical protein
MAFCDHCGDVSKALTLWPQKVHDECDCLCHRWKSKKGREFLAEEKKNSRKRKKK